MKRRSFFQALLALFALPLVPVASGDYWPTPKPEDFVVQGGSGSFGKNPVGWFRAILQADGSKKCYRSARGWNEAPIWVEVTEPVSFGTFELIPTDTGYSFRIMPGVPK